MLKLGTEALPQPIFVQHTFHVCVICNIMTIRLNVNSDDFFKPTVNTTVNFTNNNKYLSENKRYVLTNFLLLLSSLFFKRSANSQVILIFKITLSVIILNSVTTIISTSRSVLRKVVVYKYRNEFFKT